MAHFDEPYRPWRKPQTVAQIRAWHHVAQVFGRCPSSIRSLSDEVDAYIVKLEWDLTNSFEFIYAGGLLVGMPPNGRGKK